MQPVALKNLAETATPRKHEALRATSEPEHEAPFWKGKRLRSDQLTGWLLRLYSGDDIILPNYIGIAINHCKDPY